MIRTKPIADILTAARFLLGLALVWLGLRYDKETLPLAALLLLAAWITDVLDGPLARRDRAFTPTWLGENDLTADLTVAGGAWVYLGTAGFVSPQFALGYVFLAVLTLWLTHSAYVGWGIQTVPYAAMIWTTLQVAPLFGGLLVIWLGLVVVITWPRLPRKAVEFIQGIGDLFRK